MAVSFNKKIRIPTIIIILVVIGIYSKNQSNTNNFQLAGIIGSVEAGVAQNVKSDTSFTLTIPAMLATRFTTLDSFKTCVNLFYYPKNLKTVEPNVNSNRVDLVYRIRNTDITCSLESGIKEDDFVKARDGDVWDKLNLLFNSPFAVMNREDLNKIFKLSRRRPAFFGEGDVAFFDLAKTSVENINTPDLAYVCVADSSEKGYLNTFNHFTAQAFITSLFSKEMADFVSDVHERQNMPDLVTGVFSDEQFNDPNNYPVDNYIDLINNELGQALGAKLKVKYGITRSTKWTPKLLADYLNDIQNYYSWSFQIGMKPYRETDELMIRFSEKINIVSKGVPFEEVL